MHEQKCNLAAAVEWVSNLHDRVVDLFLSTMREVPSFRDPTIDKQISVYIDGLGNWVRGHYCWSFEVSFLNNTFVIFTEDILEREVLRKEWTGSPIHQTD